MGGAPWAGSHGEGRGWMASQPVPLCGLDRKSHFRNLFDWESRCFNSSGMGFSSFLALSLGVGGNLPSPARSFKQRHERSRGSTHSGQVQGQNGKDPSSPGDTQPPANSEHSPPCLPKTSGWMVSEGGGWQIHVSREWS